MAATAKVTEQHDEAERSGHEERLDRHEKAQARGLGNGRIRQQLENAEPDVASQHEQFAVGEVDHEKDAVDERVAERYKSVEAAKRDAVEDLLKQVAEGQAGLPDS
jgi:hypothetical protein